MTTKLTIDKDMDVAVHNGVLLTAGDVAAMWSDETYISNPIYGQWLPGFSGNVVIGFYKGHPVKIIVDFKTFDEVSERIVCAAIDSVDKNLHIDREPILRTFIDTAVDLIKFILGR